MIERDSDLKIRPHDNINQTVSFAVYLSIHYSAKSMKIHLRYYCGPHARLTKKQTKQETKKKIDLGKGKWKMIIKAEKGKKKQIKPEKEKRKKEKVDDEVDTCG